MNTMNKPTDTLNNLKLLIRALKNESKIIDGHNDPQAYKEAWKFAEDIIDDYKNYVYKLENRLNLSYSNNLNYKDINMFD